MMQLTKWTLMYAALVLAPLSMASAATENTPPGQMQISNKTSFPLYVFQNASRKVVLPNEHVQTADYKASAVTVTTSTPEAVIRFVTLSHSKSCKAQACVLITGN
ncbi:hypothetical protein JRG42_04025 [Pseudomonas granadensis]|uniref:hypothetical protein n=1 Tax=Pseudomonas granadensis TaxID=1421430 RepID=UPI0019D00241|nr:hypothetical protein [Pseudomonas granadensis]MBN6773184.1 hypothetical protein [Pseudomonas granadensis]MBN6803630.1 hypothetical protein [Pseudomonas granadensis]MBN6830309.1 hypothetical protein [Pseudomonas granadensis]MBN6837851.1 hypothetical protein [Pseudomonas granadensis]MBN6867213.1 hypothetical protein [Pseudomonas granadensis]